MAGPWEKYAAQPSAGPWAKYAAQPAPAPAAPQPVFDPTADVQGDIPGYAASPERQQVVEQGRADANVNQGMNAPTYVAQQTSRSVADVAGMPVDLMTGGLNALLAATGNDYRINEPFLGSDFIADSASKVGDAVGTPTVAPEEVSPGVRVLGQGARMGGGALLGAGALGAPMAQNAKGALGALAKPYSANAAAPMIRDTLAGTGAGVSGGLYDEYAPDSVQESSFGPVAKMLATILGGAGAAATTSVAEGVLGGAKNAVRNTFLGAADPNSPVNPATGEKFSREQMDMAAQVAQQIPSSKRQTLDNIDQGVKDFGQFANPKEMPTTGMLADDIGMSVQENVLRSRDPQRFLERDAARRSLASSQIENTAPANADPRKFVNTATKQYDDTLNVAKQGVDTASAKQTAATTDIQRQNADLNALATRQPEVSANLDTQFRGQLEAARGQKNALYNSVPDDTVVNGEALYNDVGAALAGVPKAARTSPEVGALTGRIRSLLEGADAEGNPIINDLTYGDVKVLRAEVNAARREAVASGKDVSYLDRVGQVLSQRIDETNPDAAKFYREEYAPKFKTGKVGEYESNLKRAARTGEESSATRPSEFGGKFLKKPEDAAALNRAIDVNGNPVTAQTAGDWMLGDMAKSGVLNENAQIRFDKMKQWADRNKAVIDQFPDVRARVDSEIANAQKGGMISNKLTKEVAAAKETLAGTETKLRSSALQRVVGNNPENAISSIMGSGDPEKQMAEIVGRMSGNKDATEGLKASVRDWIKNKAGTTSKIVGDPDSVRLSRANLDKLFKQHEKTLSKLYSPEEMNYLRQAHKLMNVEANLDVKATAGSNTLDKINMQATQSANQKKRLLEAALKAKYGVLKGGGVYRTITLFLQSLPNSSRGIEDILFEMQFNPELAKHLLTRPVKDTSIPAWNSKLNQLMGAAAGARETSEVPK